MKTLDSFAFIPTDKPLKFLSFSLGEVEQDDLLKLVRLGFNFSVTYGRVVLQYDSVALTNLVAEEITYWCDSDEIEDYKEFHQVDSFSSWKQDYFTPYINKESTLTEILDNIRSDWRLSDVERRLLKARRDYEYRDDPKYQQEQHTFGFLGKLLN